MSTAGGSRRKPVAGRGSFLLSSFALIIFLAKGPCYAPCQSRVLIIPIGRRPEDRVACFSSD
jgi:hypothetical protein